MRLQTIALSAGTLWLAAAAYAQPAQTSTPTVIRSETKLVLVDAVVTDKKGNYVTDLAQKNFKVWEDNKEQNVKVFSFEADPASPRNNQKHYMVLFFDNASVSAGDQMQARNAAGKFIDKNTGADKFIAVANFTGSLKITQNFTNDVDRLKAAVSGVKTSAVSTEDTSASSGSGFPTLSASSEFGVRSVLLALRSLARNLEKIDGRKTLVLLTAGFPQNSETQPELTATINACNRANVAIYPIDVRGLVSGIPMMQQNSPIIREDPPLALLRTPRPLFQLASFSNSFVPQRGGATGSTGGAGSSGAGTGAGSSGGSRGSSGGTGAGTTGSAGSTGSTGGSRGGTGTGTTGPVGTTGGTRGGINNGTTGNRNGNTGNTGLNNGVGRGGIYNNPSLNNNRNPLNTPRSIIPEFPHGFDQNQNALLMLAEGTGGFVIRNTNDLLGGMEKIAREQNQYYILGYSPEDSPEGTCHALKVKVDKGGYGVRSRSGYCNVHVADPLAGKPAETELEGIAVGTATGSITAPLQLPFFYSSPNVARVNVAMEIPTRSFKFEKVKGKQHAEVNVLGVASKPDGSVGAKFSDTVKLDFENKDEVAEFQKKPMHYENQFEIASGQYRVKVVFSAGGENFGKLEKPLNIDPFDGKQFAVSGIALSHGIIKTDEDSGLDAVLIQDKVPLISVGNQFVPSGMLSFKTTELAGIYMEIYDPLLLDEKPPEVGVQVKISDRKTGEVKVDSNLVQLKNYVRAGSQMVAVGLRLPVKDLAAGSYKLEVIGMDSANHLMGRSLEFEIE